MITKLIENCFHMKDSISSKCLYKYSIKGFCLNTLPFKTCIHNGLERNFPFYDKVKMFIIVHSLAKKLTSKELSCDQPISTCIAKICC